MGGLSFLTKKNFNPANWRNQKAVWEARQNDENEKRRRTERNEQLKRERDDEDLARARDAKEGDKVALKFMYGVPPGMEQKKKRDDEGYDDDEKDKDCKEGQPKFDVKRRPGDDEAAARFRMLFAQKSEQEQLQQQQRKELMDVQGNFSSLPQGNGAIDDQDEMNGKMLSYENDTRTALEKAVGRKASSSVGVSLEEQIARFPHLKHAPMASGMAGTNVNVTFKPMGATIRNVRCMKCGEWGHAKGERECRLSGWNPFALTTDKVAGGGKLKSVAVADKSKTNVGRAGKNDEVIDRSSSSSLDSEIEGINRRGRDYVRTDKQKGRSKSRRNRDDDRDYYKSKKKRRRDRDGRDKSERRKKGSKRKRKDERHGRRSRSRSR